MSLRVFPTHLFCFEGHAPDIEAREISGGVSLSGLEDVIQADGGGRIAADFTGAYLDEPDLALAWRTFAALRHPFIVPLGDIRHQLVGDIELPPGGLPWWTEEEYGTGDTGVTVAADANLRATTLQVTIDYSPTPLRPGMWFSIDHAERRHRAYRITEVIDHSGATATIKFLPPLREATSAETAVETADPRCMMRIDGAMPTGTTFGFTDAHSVRFVEDFSPSYDPSSPTLPANSLMATSTVLYIDGEPVA